VTVITSATLRRSGELDLASALTRTYPSINENAIGTNESALTS
jgi:iron complex outermembrane receptor protein